MLLRTFVVTSVLLGMFECAAAMDVSPFEVGKVLTDKQARELKQRYDKRKVQPWKPAADVNTIKGRKDADLINYGIQVVTSLRGKSCFSRTARSFDLYQ